MTTVYFIRHAQANNSVRDSRSRPLTEKGKEDRALVTAFLQDKGINAVFSSPFVRAMDTIAVFADKNHLPIKTVEDFRERRGDNGMHRTHPDFVSFLKQQWADFTYTYSDGESLQEVQNRNIAALQKILTDCKGKHIAIGTHGMALSTILAYYEPLFGYADFLAMAHKLPWAVKMSFLDETCTGVEKIDLFAEKA